MIARERRIARRAGAASFVLMVIGIAFLIISSTGSLTTIIEVQIPDHDQDDMVHAGRGSKGEEYVLEIDERTMGFLMITILHEEGEDGWVWLKVWEGKRTALRMTNATLPYVGNADLTGSGAIKVSIYCQEGGADFEDLQIEFNRPGGATWGGMIIGGCFAIPCCLIWIASLVSSIYALTNYLIYKRSRSSMDRSRGHSE
ncbi:MAG: hypothetical protein QCI82_07910 [Candidatus Thermoplasmatota archaeon]|nr:hypothetical protein [Candidatus Thermoplasmatota archaeon]